MSETVFPPKSGPRLLLLLLYMSVEVLAGRLWVAGLASHAVRLSHDSSSRVLPSKGTVVTAALGRHPAVGYYDIMIV